MKFLLEKTRKGKVINFDLSQNSLELELKKKTINLNNQEITDIILLKEIMPKLDLLAKNILCYLTEDDDDESKTGLLYDDLARLRSVILKKYEKNLSDEAINKYMKKIRFLVLELKKRLRTYNYQKVSRRTR